MHSVWNNYLLILLFYVNGIPWFWRVILDARAFLKFRKYWPGDGLFRPILVANIWSNNFKKYLCQMQYTIYFISVLDFKHNGMSCTKIKCSLFGSSHNLLASIKIRLVLLSHLSFLSSTFLHISPPTLYEVLFTLTRAISFAHWMLLP